MFKFYLVKRGYLRFVEFEGINGRLIRWEITEKQYIAISNLQDKFKSIYELNTFISQIN